MIVPPRACTFQRWRRLSHIRLSLLRSLQYECLDNLALRGLVLDIGGDPRSGYAARMRIEGQIETLNIDPTAQPTHQANLNRPLPIPSDRYDAVISLNTLEHVVEDRLALREMGRVLKPGGSVHLWVPFLYRVHEHGATKDYHRHTASAWEHMIAEAGFASESVVVEPLAFGRLASAFALVELDFPRPIRWVLRNLVLFGDTLRETLRGGSPSTCDLPLGYHVSARKPVSSL